MYLFDLNTVSLGLSVVPLTLILVLISRLKNVIFFTAKQQATLSAKPFYAAAFAALPAFLLITSPTYLTPFPLYGSGGLELLITAET